MNFNKTKLLHWALEIKEIDLTEISDFSDLRSLLFEFPLIVVREQNLGKDQFLSLMRQMGEPEEQKFSKSLVVEMSSRGKKELSAISELGWHSDQSYQIRYPDYLCLYAENVPEEKGRTHWANTELAYQNLQHEKKEQVTGLMSQHEFRHFDEYLGDLLEFESENFKRASYAMEKYVHPVVDKWKGHFHLNLNHGFTAKILDAPADLLAELLSHIIRPEFVYSHSWRRGDLIFANNHLLIHRRDQLSSPARKLFRGLFNLVNEDG